MDKPLPANLRRWFPLPDLSHSDHLIDELLQAAAPQERLGAVAGAVAQAHDRHPGLDQRPQGRLRVGLGGELGEAVEHLPDRVAVKPAGRSRAAPRPRRRGTGRSGRRGSTPSRRAACGRTSAPGRSRAVRPRRTGCAAAPGRSASRRRRRRRRCGVVRWQGTSPLTTVAVCGPPVRTAARMVIGLTLYVPRSWRLSRRSAPSSRSRGQHR